MKCLDSPLKYIRQRGRTFSIRYNEHIHTIRNNSNSRYSNHKLNTGHIYGRVNRYHGCHKGRKVGQTLNTLEKYHTCKIRQEGRSDIEYLKKISHL
jgi:hypothetical protein